MPSWLRITISLNITSLRFRNLKNSHSAVMRCSDEFKIVHSILFSRYDMGMSYKNI